VEVDFRGTLDNVRARIPALLAGKGTDSECADVSAGRKQGARGRPKLGVVSGEVTLLPRQWEWLKAKRGGASATLRRLVDEARRNGRSQDLLERRQQAVYRFMNIMAGDRAGYEEALRALYAKDKALFVTHTSTWPQDIKQHLMSLVSDVVFD